MYTTPENMAVPELLINFLLPILFRWEENNAIQHATDMSKLCAIQETILEIIVTIVTICSAAVQQSKHVFITAYLGSDTPYLRHWYMVLMHLIRTNGDGSTRDACCGGWLAGCTRGRCV